MARGLDRPAQGLDAGGDDVVGVHSHDWLRMERCFADRHAVFLRHGGGGLFSEFDEGIHDLATKR